MKNNRSKLILAFVLIDAVLFVVCLLSFAYFHHVRDLWGSVSDDGIIAARPTPDTHHSAGTTAPGKETSSAAPPDTDEVTAPQDPDTYPDVTDSPDTTGAPDTTPPEPPHKFEELFAPEGEIEITGNSYRSHDICVTVTEITEPISDYVARYFIYDVYIRYTENLFSVYDDTRHPFTDFVEAGGYPVAAISGDFWGHNADIAVRNGVTLRQKKVADDDFCVLRYDGTLETHYASEYSSFEITDDIYQIWNFGPALLDGEGHARTDFGSKNDIKHRNPRASIGYYEPGHYCFIVVDGRLDFTYEGETSYFRGMRLYDLAKLYEELGCRAAFNLDGGDSAFAYFNGEIIRQDNDRSQPGGDEPRNIYDIICIGELG